MSKTIDLILTELENFNQSIRNTLNVKNITNTGEAANSLRIEVSENTIKDFGVFYLEFLDTGRGGGSFPNLTGIKKWVVSKLGITDEKKVNQVAFLVGRKIAAIGTAIFLDNSKGLQLTEKIETLRTAINQEIGKTAKADVIERLDKFKKQFANKQKFQI